MKSLTINLILDYLNTSASSKDIIFAGIKNEIDNETAQYIMQCQHQNSDIKI